MAHPVRPESYQEINNFYTTTIYNKGAEVIRMQHTLLGKEGFRRGMDLYFERHDGHAVTIDDFVAAMEDANGVDFTQFKRWYSQAGTPEVTVKSDYQKGCLTLTLTQYCPPTPECKDKKPFYIPIRLALFNSRGELMPIKNEVLVLHESTQTYTFEGLTEKPVVSLLRDFSAPVLLHVDTHPDDLLALLRFETDGFAKWDASQNLALQSMLSWYESAPEKWQLPKALVEAYQHVLLDETLDAALRAELLTVPGFDDVAANLNNIDVEKIEAVRDFFRAELGRVLFKDLHACYESLWKQEDHSMHGKAYSSRKLRNVCLNLMMRADEKKAQSLCLQQFANAKTMTDQVASFASIVNGLDEKASQKAIADFYQQWKNDDLVLDKWFALQASCERPHTLASVKGLLSHPAFNIKNPNKVRSVVGVFSQMNPRHFHAIDGSGYAFLTEMLKKMDKINPQIAARLATPFSRWQRLNAPRQALMKQQLEHLASMELSRDLRELVLKSLAN